ncbi:MAG: DNA polymerase I, partial [Candidatus Aenigmarchaeota archaeon]|nr:DNA polymerase I [Candidatus Aenigmarchaeota archaeon]
MSKSKPRIILFDGNAVVHRAYHALPPLTTKKGELVNAVYGFSSILLKVLKELNPDYVAVAFDSPEPTFRHKEFLEYKAKRKATPEDLSPQFLQVKEVLSALNIPIFEVAGYEADDLVGTLANKVPSNLESIIVTGDLDELQLVDNHTKVYTMRRGFTDTILYDEKMIKDRFNLTPEQFVDYKALKGDPSDNIPGVPGIGEKTAAELISKFGSLEYLYKNLDRVGGKTKEVLEKNKDQAFISKKLVKIVTEVPIKFNLSACKTHDFDRQKVFELFRKLEFKSLLNKLPRTKKEEVKIPKKRPHIKTAGYKLIDNKRDFKNLLANLKKQEFLAVDTETDGWDIVENKLVGISFSFKEKEAYYIPVGHTIA